MDVLQAIKDPYEQGQALGKLIGDVLPTGEAVGGAIGKVARLKIRQRRIREGGRLPMVW